MARKKESQPRNITQTPTPSPRHHTEMLQDTTASPEIKKLMDKLAPNNTHPPNMQAKYEAILQRKSYDHHCFMECVRLRLEANRGMQSQQDVAGSVQTDADLTFTHMLTHSML